MTQELKVGQRVRVTIEGTVGDTYGDDYDLAEADSIEIEVRDGYSMFLESALGLDLASWEVIPEPLKDGLYYDTDSDSEPFSQMSLVYKLEEGQWYDSSLDKVKLTDGVIAGLVRMGPVDS